MADHVHLGIYREPTLGRSGSLLSDRSLLAAAGAIVGAVAIAVLIAAL
jgi:hypothetical protein